MGKLDKIPGLAKDTEAAISDAIKTAARRASPLTIGIAVIIVSAGLFLWFNRETLLRMQETYMDVQHLKYAHDHCYEELSEVKARLSVTEREVQRLKDRTAQN